MYDLSNKKKTLFITKQWILKKVLSTENVFWLYVSILELSAVKYADVQYSEPNPIFQVVNFITNCSYYDLNAQSKCYNKMPGCTL